MASTFDWGGQTWGCGDLDKFKAWLEDHGANYDTWANDHPDANDILNCVGSGNLGLGGLSNITQITQVEQTIAPSGPPGPTPEPAPNPPTPPVQSDLGAVSITLAGSGPGGENASGGSGTGVGLSSTTGTGASGSPAGQIEFTHTDLENLWISNGGFVNAADVAAAIAQAESGGCRFAHAGPLDDRPESYCTWTDTNGENSYGLWQINIRAHPQYDGQTLYDQNENAKAAIAVSNNGTDFTPWTTFVDGAYAQYLTGKTPISALPSPELRPASGLLSGVTADWQNIVGVFKTSIPAENDKAAAVADSLMDIFT